MIAERVSAGSERDMNFITVAVIGTVVTLGVLALVGTALIAYGINQAYSGDN